MQTLTIHISYGDIEWFNIDGNIHGNLSWDMTPSGYFFNCCFSNQPSWSFSFWENHLNKWGFHGFSVASFDYRRLLSGGILHYALYSNVYILPMIIQHIKLHMYTELCMPNDIPDYLNYILPNDIPKSIPIPNPGHVPPLRALLQSWSRGETYPDLRQCAVGPGVDSGEGKGHTLRSFATELWKMDHLYPFVVFCSIETGDLWWIVPFEHGDFRELR